MLFFKQDNKSSKVLDVFVESYTPQPSAQQEDQRQAVEVLINEQHLDQNGVLRCSIAVGAPNALTHLFVFEQLDGDRLYMVRRFDESHQAQLNLQKQAAKVKLETPKA